MTLTKQQQAFLEATEALFVQNHRAPTHRELAQVLQINVSAVFNRRVRLIALGYLEQQEEPQSRNGVVLSAKWSMEREKQGKHFHYGPCRRDSAVCQAHMGEAKAGKPSSKRHSFAETSMADYLHLKATGQL